MPSVALTFYRVEVRLSMSTELIGMRVNKLSVFKVGDNRFGYLQFEYRGVLS